MVRLARQRKTRARKISYELQPGRLGENLRRMFRWQIEGALAVAKGGKEPDDTPVHAMRKHLKKARAVLQLVRERIGRAHFRQQDHCLRDVGRLISQNRDAEVRWQTMRQLEDVTYRHRQDAYGKLEVLLAFELENFVLASAGWEKEAIALLDQARNAMETWPIDNYNTRHLRRAVQRTYKSGRCALAVAKSKLSTGNLHELRKQVKLLGYQLRMLRPLNEVVVGTLSDELTELGDLLGCAHDLSFLAERLRVWRSDPDWRKQEDEILEVIESTQAELQRDAAELAERFFGERPSEFGSLLEEWFEEWPKAKSSSVAGALITTI